MHRINEALVMERAERKMAQSIKDRDERKENHEIGIIAPIETALSYREVDAALTRMEDENRPTIEGDPLPPPAALIVELAAEIAKSPEIVAKITGLYDLPRGLPIADIIEDAIKRRLGS